MSLSALNGHDESKPSDWLKGLPERAFYDGVLKVLDNHEIRLRQADELVKSVAWIKGFLKYMTPLMIGALLANVDPESPVGRMLQGALSYIAGQ